MGVGGCRCPISSRAVHSSSPFRAFVYSVPTSASAADAMTLRSSLHTLWTAPLSGVVVVPGLLVSGGLLLRKKWPPARLRTRGALKYEASL
eukprot:15356587-Ditylum_brightwellii.AAC.1